MSSKVDYKEQYRNAVNTHLALWERLLDEHHPKRNCVPIIQEKVHQILEQINQLQLKVGEPATPGFIGAKLDELHLYAETCLHIAHELPKNPSVAMEELERQIIVGRTSSDVAHRVMNWEKRFAKASAKSSDCAPLVLGKARDLLNQLQQLDDISPEDLLKARRTGIQYLETYAERCLNEGAEAVRQLDLPKPYHRPLDSSDQESR